MKDHNTIPPNPSSDNTALGTDCASNVVPFPMHLARPPRPPERTRYGRQKTLYVSPTHASDEGWDCLQVDDGGSLLVTNVPWIEAVRAAATYFRETTKAGECEPRVTIEIGRDGGEYPEFVHPTGQRRRRNRKPTERSKTE